MAQLPTVADLRERRTELLRAELREALLGRDFDRFRGVVEPLTAEFDVVDIALAAVSLMEGAGVQDADEVELASPPLVTGPAPRPARPGPARGGFRPGPPGPDRRGDGTPWVRIFVGGGRRAGMRPGDLVGAIVNEAHVPSGAVGAIEIDDGFSFVDIRAEVAGQVVEALKRATIRGRRLQVRLEP